MKSQLRKKEEFSEVRRKSEDPKSSRIQPHKKKEDRKRSKMPITFQEREYYQHKREENFRNKTPAQIKGPSRDTRVR